MVAQAVISGSGGGGGRKDLRSQNGWRPLGGGQQQVGRNIWSL